MSMVTGGEGSRGGSGERDTLRYVYPQLTLTNYTCWKIRVKAMMEDQEVWEAIEPAAGAAVDVKKDKKAKLHLIQCLPEDLLLQVANKATAKEIWDCLKTRFVGADRVRDARLQTLKSEFDGMRMKEDESVDQYAGRLSAMAVRYSSLGGSLNDAALVKKLFDTVPEHFITVIAGIEQFCDLSTLVFEEAVGRLKAFEERTRRPTGGATGDGQLLFTQAEWEARQKKAVGEGSGKGKSSDVGTRGRGRGRGTGRGHGGRSGGRGNSTGKEAAGGGTRDYSHIQCFNCRNYGHFASRCKEPKKGEEAHSARTETVEQALLLAVSEELTPLEQVEEKRPETLLLVEDNVFPELYLTGKDITTGNTWYLDTGASNHMSGDREKFQELDEAITGKVRFGDGSTVQIMGKGSILFECKNGDQWALKEVYYIPRLCNNLISLGQMTEIGYRVVLDGGKLEVIEKSTKRLIMKVQRSANRLYHIELTRASPVATSHLKKLDDRSQQLVYLGVEDGCKAHRLLDPRRGKIIVSRDVKFEENVPWQWDDGADMWGSTEFHKGEGFGFVWSTGEEEEAAGSGQKAEATKVMSPAQRQQIPTPASVEAMSPARSQGLGGVPVAHGSPSDQLDATIDLAQPQRYRSLADIYNTSVPIEPEYPEELLLTSAEEPSNKDAIDIFKKEMKSLFRMSDLGLLSYYLGIEVFQGADGIGIKQAAYAEKLLERSGMANCNPCHVPMEARLKLSKSSTSPFVDATKYRSIVGCLRYLVHTRPDLAYSVGYVSRFMQEPHEEHYAAVKHILRYIAGTRSLGCFYGKKKGDGRAILTGFSDSDMAGDPEDRKSTTGVLFFFGHSPITWQSQKQKVVALSSCEAEYIAATTAACQGVWLSRLLSDLIDEEPKAVTLNIGNKSAIALCKNPVFHDRSKHIETRYHFIRECIEDGRIAVEYMATNNQLADILTKALGRVKFLELRDKIGMVEIKEGHKFRG
ncbi:hypothetical protein Vadar_028059 [Vaccinium darrowii]|uniref:Uncharacterized protein n=1 Tax=Vaccinium darrowii TaxID=229202 RepID=A0ACB7YZY1_9ERIC|nr:hypothetical protein Vadar_028059 [Vaccinium darrowii]